MTIKEIVENNIQEYNFTTVEPMDNYWSMDRFLKDFDFAEFITHHDGTYVELSDGDYTIGLHSGGNGDFCSHKIRFEIL